MLYAITTTSSSVASNGVFPLTTISRRTGCINELINNGIVIKKAGYYQATASITFTTPTAGLVTVQLYKDGVAVPGATASVTTGDTTSVNTLTLDLPTRVFCHEGTPVYTLVNTGVAVTASNITLEIRNA